MITKIKIRKNATELGFTLIETLVAIIIFGTMVASFLPLFGTYKAATIRSDMRLGASAVTQRVMDELRRADVRLLPSTGTVEKLPDAPNGTGESTTSMTYKGRIYRVAITYCNPTSDCTADSRRIAVKTYYGSNSDPIFQLETVYTELRN